MKITHARSEIVALPADEPLADAPDKPGGTRPTVLLELGTDEGIEGIGFTFFGAGLTPALHSAVQALAERVIGCDPLCIETVTRRAKDAAAGAGPAGIFTLARSRWRRSTSHCGTSRARR
jgi:L-alanine-DL-glutamate epimerase-like enolase superfamily enzyme